MLPSELLLLVFDKLSLLERHRSLPMVCKFFCQLLHSLQLLGLQPESIVGVSQHEPRLVEVSVSGQRFIPRLRFALRVDSAPRLSCG